MKRVLTEKCIQNPAIHEGLSIGLDALLQEGGVFLTGQLLLQVLER